MHSHVVVVGGGPGGYAAAFLAADLGMDVTLVEADARLGGTCLLRGCIPSKALLHVARVIEEAHEMAAWGVEFGRPKIDVDALRARKEKVIATLSGGLKQLAKQRKVRVVQARGTFENSTTLRLAAVDGAAPPAEDRLTFDYCVLATGSTPTKIPAFDLGTDRVTSSTGALALTDVPESLLVVGGGYIGLEMGSVYARLGTRVSVVEMTSGLLPGADRDLVKPLQARLEKLFAGIHLNTKVTAQADRTTHVDVTLQGADGAQRTESFARVLVSVGRTPCSRGLGLENTKVVVDARGFVQVDRRQRTADERIFAIGDVAGEPMLAHKAAHEGRTAVEVIHGDAAAEFDPACIPAVVFTDPEIAWTGLTEEQASKLGRAVEVARYPWAASGRAQALGRTEGMTKVVVDPETERILGVGIVGPGAGDLISEAVLAVEMGATVEDVARSIHPHPTLSETVAFAAETYLGTATEIYKPRRPRREG